MAWASHSPPSLLRPCAGGIRPHSRLRGLSVLIVHTVYLPGWGREGWAGPGSLHSKCTLSRREEAGNNGLTVQPASSGRSGWEPRRPAAHPARGQGAYLVCGQGGGAQGPLKPEDSGQVASNLLPAGGPRVRFSSRAEAGGTEGFIPEGPSLVSRR